MLRTQALLFLLSSIALPMAAFAQGDTTAAAPETHVVVMAADVAYQPLEVPGFDPGMRLAVLHGDPMGASGPYVVRLAFPDGYRFPAHWHPQAENVTVLNGTLLLGMGAEEDPAAMTEYPPGSYLYLPAENV
ncbi:MAG TPA: cupin domain-containing protein, partial [Thermoanaerobaculia bacterium]